MHIKIGLCGQAFSLMVSYQMKLSDNAVMMKLSDEAVLSEFELYYLHFPFLSIWYVITRCNHIPRKKKWCQSELPICKGSSTLSIMLGKGSSY